MRAAWCSVLLFFSAGCHAGEAENDVPRAKTEYKVTPNKARKYSPVQNKNAPTIDELRAQGFVSTGVDSEMFACGEACDAQHDYAKFMGRKVGAGKVEHLFTCPRPAENEDWRCEPFYGFGKEKTQQ